AVILAVTFLLVLVHLHRRLSFFSSHPLPHDHSAVFHPLLDDLDSDPIPAASKANEDRIDVLDHALLENDSNDEFLLLEEEEEEEEEDAVRSRNSAATSSDFFFDHLDGVIRRSYNRRSVEEWEDYIPFHSKSASDLGFGNDAPLIKPPPFGSDDTLMDDKLRARLNQVTKMEDALLLKGSVLRKGWGEWFEKKADFMRRDSMFRSSIEIMNPSINPVLQDSNGGAAAASTGFTRGDKLFLKGILNELKKTSFMAEKRQPESSSGKKRRLWGYYPWMDDGILPFANFMDAFFRTNGCNMRVFMVWNSPPWMFGVRHQRGMESLFYHHSDACVVVFSETMELDFFSRFVNDSYKVAVVMPDLDELLSGTPSEIFAPRWHESRRTKHYQIHYSELIRLAAIYKYGGIYLDSDVIVLKPLYELNNSVGYGDEMSLSGAVMTFRKHSPFVMECLSEFYASYDDAKLRWNGADLLTRVVKRTTSKMEELHLQSPSVFFPISRSSILRYFAAPESKARQVEQDEFTNTILRTSFTFHFWNSLTAALVPHSGSLVYNLLNTYCIYCSDAL
ncbi:hypothetical protein M569_02514, partial [Genlisea aurea]